MSKSITPLPIPIAIWRGMRFENRGTNSLSSIFYAIQKVNSFEDIRVTGYSW
jgi:hypothetical protein